MPSLMRPGDVLAGRYRLVVLLSENRGGKFWRAMDEVLARHVALHLIPEDDERAEGLMTAARASATLHDPRLLRVLDADSYDGVCYVVNEWGEGRSLDHILQDGPLTPRRAAWLVGEVGELIAKAHAAGLAHGRLVPENALVDESGAVKVIGFAVDAALHGLPVGRAATDVVDLAGVLYAALTGKWPGISASALPPAPQEHGRPLRPRQVRAGVPRVLDTLCDEVLSPVAPSRDHGYTSAQAIVDALHEFVGDPAAVAEAEAALSRENTSSRLPRVEAPLLEETVALGGPGAGLEPAPEPEPEPESQPEPEPAPESQPAPEPAPGPPTEPAPARAAAPAEETQAGVPVFYDHIEEVGWASPSEQAAPPPPPFEEPEAKPLFAPEPPDGRPARVPRDVPLRDSAEEFWPWGSGPVPVITEPPVDDEHDPGRRWLRIAGVIAACLLVLVAMVYAFGRGRDGTGFGEDDPNGATSPAGQGAQITVQSADDFDPLADPPEENPETARLAIDGDPATAWHTQTYLQDLGPKGLKTGVGLLLDLGQPTEVGEVALTFGGAPTALRLLAAPGDEPPTGIDGLETLAETTAAGTTVTVDVDDPVASRYLVVWLTSLPAVPGGFRGEIAEIVVRG